MPIFWFLESIGQIVANGHMYCNGGYLAAIILIYNSPNAHIISIPFSFTFYYTCFRNQISTTFNLIRIYPRC